MFIIGGGSITVDMVENPPVNPITGASRSGAAVQAELRVHQGEVRRNATIPPIFHGDYIFFTVRGKGVKLGRVAHAPYGGAIKAQDFVDVVEYEHTSHAFAPGYFGTFKPLANDQHDPNVKGSKAFIRHYDVKREDVVVFNVGMSGKVSTGLRVTLESLRRLAAKLPDQYKLPARIPSTHTTRLREPPPPPAARSQKRRLEDRQSGEGANEDNRLQVVKDPVANVGDRVLVYWVRQPRGWFAGEVAAHARENGVWVSRIKYDACDKWDAHFEWHRLDAADPNHVQWRLE